MTRKIILLVGVILIHLSAWACPVCERNQPKVLKGITHGTGPESQWDYVIVWITILIVLLTLFFSVKWLIRPGEKSPEHIKRVILNQS
jgi:choline-glycine betaine transporter